MDMDEKIVSTNQIYNGRVVNFAVHEVELPDGKRAKRELIRHPGAVAMVALDDNNNVFMVRQFRIAAARVMFEIPAGTLNKDEEPLHCAERELQEEIGYRAASMEPLGGFFVAPGYTTEFIHLFLATGLSESRLEADADEFIEVARFTLAEAIAMVERGEIVDGKTISGLLRVGRRLGV